MSISPVAPAAPENPLPSAEEREPALYARFRELGIAWTAFIHAPVFTVEEAQTLRGSIPGIHTKNLFLYDKKGAQWLVVAREELSLDLNALAKMLGRPRFSFGSPARLGAFLGVIPGAVTPFALMNDIGVHVNAVFDQGMLVGPAVNFHPLRNDRTISVTPSDLVRFAKACGHAPLIMDLPLRS